jgi:hypothetical protein
MTTGSKHGMGAWYDAPKVHHAQPAGTLVAEPAIAHGCWACAQRGQFRGMAPRARSCSLRARNGKLTCQAHRKLEQAARELQAQRKAAQQGAA